jgi:hypothetical protein
VGRAGQGMWHASRDEKHIKVLVRKLEGKDTKADGRIVLKLILNVS